jgi:tyrosyl-tRNA synthetase
MNFIEELKWRGMLHDMTPGAEEQLASGMQTAYIGFDPTAPSLTIGNYVQIMMLSLWQRSGNKPIILMGGATGRIGDPSGKDKERELKSYDELDNNLEHQKNQFYKFLDFSEIPNAAEFKNNLDFYRDMPVLEFLRTVGKTLTVNYMMSKDSVKNRLETGISFTEFSYQLLQAYDFQCLFEQNNCSFQIGGSDQWGNITSGSEFIRRNIGGKAFAVTTPLLTKSDGSKFGKSAEGNIWLDPEMTSPYNFYQFWINADDADIPKYLRYFSYKTKTEIEALEETYKEDPRSLKKILAEEITGRVHSPEAVKSIQKVSNILFNKKLDKTSLNDLSPEDYKLISKEIPCYTITQAATSGEVNIIDLMTETTDILKSKGEARRAISGNAISVNLEKISDIEYTVNADDFFHNKYMMLQNGKKNKYLIEIDG